MYIIVGLGNPGEQYENTRHNIGFMVIDRLVDEYGIALDTMSRKAFWGKGSIKSRPAILMKPMTYMNGSGVAVREFLRVEQTHDPELIVIHDDLDLELGRIRIRQDGGSGGHKGLQSIMDCIGTDKFTRIRLGIGRPTGRQDAADYVLRDFKDKEYEEVAFAVIRAADAIDSIIDNGVDKTMNEFNRSAIDDSE